MGDLVELVTEKNSDLKYGLDDIIGVTLEKQMIPTIANLTQTNLDDFIIVHPKDFVYNPRTHGKQIGLGFNTSNRCYIATWNNNTFRVKPQMMDTVLPEFLYLHFLRDRWDKEACFHAWGSSTVVLLWSSFCDMSINVPPLPEQQKIVQDYQVIEDRIALLHRINDNLEEQIMALYHKTFDVVGACREGTAAELGEIVGGATPSTDIPEYFCDDGIVWLSPKDLTGTGLKFIFRGETDITEAGYNSCSTKMVPVGTVLLTSRAPVGTVAIAMKELCTNQGFKSIVPKAPCWTSYIYCLLKDNKQLLEANASGTTFLEISGDALKKLAVPIPDEGLVQDFSEVCAPIFKQQMLYEQEITQLNSLVSIRVSSIAKGA